MRTATLIVLLLAGLPTAADAAPALTMSSSHLIRGATVTVHGTGFTPDGGILSHLVRPDGSEYPEAIFRADARGEITHRISIILTEVGTYELQMIDQATKAVATTRFMVLESTMPPVSNADRTPSAFSGVWFGDASRNTPRGERKESVLVSLAGGDAGAVVGTTAYPSLGCGGELWLMGTRGDAVVFGEQITYGEERCPAHGIVSAKVLPDGRLELERHTAEEPQAPPATGVLARRK